MIRVAISYRVLQHWRTGVFSRLARAEGVYIRVFFGDSFHGSKVVSYGGSVDFDVRQMRTIKIKIHTRNGLAHIPLNPSLWRELKLFDPDIIITEGASNALNNLICYLFAKANGRKIVQWGLGEIKGREPSFSRKLIDLIFFRRVERLSDAAIAYSTRGAEYYKSIGIPKSMVYTAVNTVDTETRQKNALDRAVALGKPWPSPVPESFNVLFVGALTSSKNVDTLLRSFSLLLRDGVDATLTVVGDGPHRERLEHLSLELGITEAVFFAGHVSNGIEDFFYSATVMVLPGLGGLAVSDALCHGVPVICGVGDGSEADLVNGSNGLILDPLNVETLHHALYRLYMDESLQSGWRTSAPACIDARYNIGSYVGVIEQCIRDLASISKQRFGSSD